MNGDDWDRQLLRLASSVFTADRIEWAVFTKSKIIFKDCVLAVDVPTGSSGSGSGEQGFKAGDTVERIEFKTACSSSENWHFKLFRSKADKKKPLIMDFCMAWRPQLLPQPQPQSQ